MKKIINWLKKNKQSIISIFVGSIDIIMILFVGFAVLSPLGVNESMINQTITVNSCPACTCGTLGQNLLCYGLIWLVIFMIGFVAYYASTKK